MEQTTIWSIIKVGSLLILLVPIYYIGGIMFGYPTNSPTQEDGRLSEDILITLDFSTETSFTLYLPALMSKGSIAAIYRDLTNLDQEPSDTNLNLQWVTINQTDYLKLNGTLTSVQLHNHVNRPHIADDVAAYESYIFSLYFSGKGNQTIPLLQADKALTLRYQYDGVTNLCQIDAGFTYQVDKPLEPNTTISIPQQFIGICA